MVATIGSIAIACSSTPSISVPPTIDPAAEACPSTPEELQYGCPLNADGTMTFQPDVVTVTGGARAIRSLATDGVTWAIDANAPGASDIAVGKVLYVTDLAVGRVLKASSGAGTVDVILGPAELGEIIRDGELRWDEPVSLGDMEGFVAPDLPGLDTEPADDDLGLVGPASLVAFHQPQNTALEAADDEELPPLEVVIDKDNRVYAFCCTPKAGAILDLDEGGIRFEGGIWLETAKAEMMGYAKMKDGHFSEGVIQVTGITGIHFEFRSATAPDAPPENFRKLFVIPVHYRPTKTPKLKRQGRIPLLKTGWQADYIRTAFSAGSTSMNGTGDYKLGSNVLAVSFKDGDIKDVELPTVITTKTSLLDSVTGVSVGVNGFAIAWAIQFCLCIGTHVNSNGLYIQLRPKFGVSNDSSAVGVLGGRCRSVTFAADARVGAGHFVSPSWANEFNAAYNLTGKTAVTATTGVTQQVELWDEVDSVPEGIRRCT